MGIAIPGVTTPGISPEHPPASPSQVSRARFPESDSRLGNTVGGARDAARPDSVPTREELARSVQVLEESFRLFNRRLRFSVNEQIQRVVVKVVDGNTDKVIKEIPPEEIQRLIVRIRETIGLLFDEQI